MLINISTLDILSEYAFINAWSNIIKCNYFLTIISSALVKKKCLILVKPHGTCYFKNLKTKCDPPTFFPSFAVTISRLKMCNIKFTGIHLITVFTNQVNVNIIGIWFKQFYKCFQLILYKTRSHVWMSKNRMSVTCIIHRLYLFRWRLRIAFSFLLSITSFINLNNFYLFYNYLYSMLGDTRFFFITISQLHFVFHETSHNRSTCMSTYVAPQFLQLHRFSKTVMHTVIFSFLNFVNILEYKYNMFYNFSLHFILEIKKM